MTNGAIVITNNELSEANLKGKYDIVFVEGSLMDVLKAVRDYIHKGHKLLTHPLMGSIKPNETPYKTVLISKSYGKTIDVDSLKLIESSIHTAEKFLKMNKTPKWTERILEDFKLIDYDLIYNAIK